MSVCYNVVITTVELDNAKLYSLFCDRVQTVRSSQLAEDRLMDIVSLLILLGAIVAADEILNNQMKVSKRLLDWLDREETRQKAPNKLPKSTRF